MKYTPRFATGNPVTVKCLTAILLSFSCFFIVACSSKTAPFEPTDALGIANKWVYDSMKLYYYWSDQMTSKPDYTLPTDDFFKKLLSASDRFSWSSNRSNIGPAKTTAELFGFQYTLINHPFIPAQLAGVITLVAPDSYAGRINLRRGMFFTKINDKIITAQNMQSLVTELASNSSAILQLATLNSSGTALTDSTRTGVQSSYVSPKCVYATRLFEQQGIKTGYLAYFQLVENEDAVLLQAIQKCKNAGVSELILDLRYNPGGSVASSAKLAAMLVPSFNPDQVYVILKGNKNGGIVKQTFRQTIAFSGSSSGKDMNELQSRNLGLKRIFILTSAATVSAAELLCNNLKPYMQVIRIGTTTHGKDEASFSIQDNRNPRQVQWILMPTIYKIFDAIDKGNYSSGLQPDYEINDFSSLPLQDFGLPGDLSVGKALQLIYGTDQVGVTTLRKKTYGFPAVKAVFNSGASSQGIEVKR